MALALSAKFNSSFVMLPLFYGLLHCNRVCNWSNANWWRWQYTAARNRTLQIQKHANLYQYAREHYNRL